MKRKILDNPNVIEWALYGNTGRSSEYMAAILCEVDPMKEVSYPLDPSDFERCLGLLIAAPELKKNMHLLKSIHPVWKDYVENWDIMESLYKKERPSGSAPELYKLMESFREKNTKSKTHSKN